MNYSTIKQLTNAITYFKKSTMKHAKNSYQKNHNNLLDNELRG